MYCINIINARAPYVSVLQQRHKLCCVVTMLFSFCRSAAFFFHGHVTALLRRAATARGGAGGFEFVDSLPHPPHGRGVRVWCPDAAGLRACLRWYCAQHLSDDERAWCDAHAWDDASFESDPRVFQAFVWQSSASGASDEAACAAVAAPEAEDEAASPLHSEPAPVTPAPAADEVADVADQDGFAGQIPPLLFHAGLVQLRGQLPPPSCSRWP